MQAALALVQEVAHGTTRGAEAVVESDAAFRDIGLAVERLAGGVTTIESTAEVVTRAVDQAATAIGALTGRRSGAPRPQVKSRRWRTQPVISYSNGRPVSRSWT
jgi:hypothetical protein